MLHRPLIALLCRAACCAAFGAAPGAQDPAANPALRVAFVGHLDTDRGRDFTAFLKQQFGAVGAFELGKCTPADLRSHDVVVLDWPQDEGVMALFEKKIDKLVHPLGELERWNRPAVLIGSAGLNTAAAWSVPGSYG